MTEEIIFRVYACGFVFVWFLCAFFSKELKRLGLGFKNRCAIALFWVVILCCVLCFAILLLPKILRALVDKEKLTWDSLLDEFENPNDEDEDDEE